VMKGEAHGTQQPRHINLIGEGVSTAQRSNSLVQSINQRFLSCASIKINNRPIVLLSRYRYGHKPQLMWTIAPLSDQDGFLCFHCILTNLLSLRFKQLTS